MDYFHSLVPGAKDVAIDAAKDLAVTGTMDAVALLGYLQITIARVQWIIWVQFQRRIGEIRQGIARTRVRNQEQQGITGRQP